MPGMYPQPPYGAPPMPPGMPGAPMSMTPAMHALSAPAPPVVPGFSQDELDKMCKLYVGNISGGVTDGWIEKLLTVCGPLSSWKRVKNTDGTLKPFGFATYRDVDSVLRAMSVIGGESSKSKLSLELPSLDGTPWKRIMLKLDQNTEKMLTRYKEARPTMSADADLERQCRIRAEEVLGGLRMVAPPVENAASGAAKPPTHASPAGLPPRPPSTSTTATAPSRVAPPAAAPNASVDDAVNRFLTDLAPGSKGNNQPTPPAVAATPKVKPVFTIAKQSIGSAFQKLGSTGDGSSKRSGAAMSLDYEDDEEEALRRKRTKIIPLDYSSLETTSAAGAEEEEDEEEVDTAAGALSKRGNATRRAPVAVASTQQDETSIKRHVMQTVVPPEEDTQRILNYDIPWAHLTPAAVQGKIRPFVQIKLGELMGESEEELVGFVVDKVSAHVSAQELTDEMAEVLDEDAALFVVRLWRMVIFESEVGAALAGVTSAAAGDEI
ncbi:hypothetical protein RI367_005123 [Sorochytrium milnesiophthora]